MGKREGRRDHSVILKEQTNRPLASLRQKQIDKENVERKKCRNTGKYLQREKREERGKQR